MSRLQTITLTAKLKLKPASDQAELLRNTMRRYRDACNFVSKYIAENGPCTPKKLRKALYGDIREKFELSAQLTVSVLKTVESKYKQIKTVDCRRAYRNGEYKPSSKGKQTPLVHFKKPYIDYVWNRGYSFQKYTFSLSTLQGRTLVRFEKKGMEQYFDGTWKFGTAKIVTKHGKWYLHIPMTKDVEVPEITGDENIVGVDLGINFLAVSYDSHGKTTFWPGGFVKQKRSTYQHVRQSLHEKGTRSAMRRLKKNGQRENRWMNDVNHCISKALVEQNPEGTLFVLENLTGFGYTLKKIGGKNRHLLNTWAFDDLRRKIEYKAARHGDLVIAVPPAYTSQTCPLCGYVDASNRDKRHHIFCCKNCGYRSNDDRVGAMNLHKKGIEYHAVSAEYTLQTGTSANRPVESM